MLQIETSKLNGKKIKEQLGQLKDREIEVRLSNLRRNNNFNNNHNNNNNYFGGRPTANLPGSLPPLPSPGVPDEPIDPFAGATPLPRNHLELTLQHLHIHARYLHCQIIILCLQK